MEGIFVTVWILLAAALWFVRTTHAQIPGVLGEASEVTAQNVFQSVNSARAKEGSHQLIWNDSLAQAAQAKANDMIARNYWSHVTPDGKQPWSFIDATGYNYKLAGENLARNFSNTPNLVEAWLASPTHRANLLHNAYQETGIAAVKGNMDGRETILVVQMFAATGGGAQTGAVELAPLPGEVSDQAPNIRRWLAPEESVIPAPQILGRAVQIDQVTLYRTGMVFILGVAVGLLVLDSFHPRHRAKHPKHRHPLLHPSKHVVHIALLMATLLTVGLAEVGALL
jgi:hypothetical protein